MTAGTVESSACREVKALAGTAGWEGELEGGAESVDKSESDRDSASDASAAVVFENGSRGSTRKWYFAVKGRCQAL